MRSWRDFRRGYFWSFIARGRDTIVASGLLDHVVARTISIRTRIGSVNSRNTTKREREKGGGERERARNESEVEVGEKKARRRAGNRARVEFALTRPVPASGVVARLVARRVNLSPEKLTTISKCTLRRIASRSARGSKKSPPRFQRLRIMCFLATRNARKNAYFQSCSVIGQA